VELQNNILTKVYSATKMVLLICVFFVMNDTQFLVIHYYKMFL